MPLTKFQVILHVHLQLLPLLLLFIKILLQLLQNLQDQLLKGVLKCLSLILPMESINNKENEFYGTN